MNDSVKKLNPNHRTVKATDGQWFKIAALLLQKLPGAKALITEEDVVNLASLFDGEHPTIVLDDKHDGLHLYLVPESEGRAMAAKAGGLPI